MSRMLSQAEIDALLQTAARQQTSSSRERAEQQVSPYNFRRPDRVSKEQLRSLHFLHERYAVNVATSLSAFLRTVTEVGIVSVEQFAYSEFLMSLPDPTAFYAFSMAPLDGTAALEVNPAVAFTMIDRMLGGTGETSSPTRGLTEIEQNVLDSVVKVVLEHLTETWRTITDVQFKIQDRETRPQVLRVTGPNEIVIVLVFEIRIAQARGTLSVCFPAAVIETLEAKLTQGGPRNRRQPTPAEQARLLANLSRVPLEVATVLETRLLARELLALRAGDVISLGHAATTPVEVQVGHMRRYLGRLTAGPSGAAVRIERGSGDTARGGTQ